MIETILGITTTLLGGGVVVLSIYGLRAMTKLNDQVDEMGGKLEETRKALQMSEVRVTALSQLNEDLHKVLKEQVEQLKTEAAIRKKVEQQRDELVEIALKGLDPKAVATKINEELQAFTKLGKP